MLVLEVMLYLFIFNSAHFGPFYLFWAFWGYFWGLGQVQKHFWDFHLGPFFPFWVPSRVGVRFNNILWTFYYRISTLILKNLSLSFILIQPYLGPFLPFLGLFLGLGSCLKTFLRPTNADYQLWFWKYSPIFKFSFRPHWGAFLAFLCPSGLFLGSGSGSTNFVGLTNVDYHFWFWKFRPIF